MLTHLLRADDADIFDEDAPNNEPEEGDDESGGKWRLSISREQARHNYCSAGTEVMEPVSDIKEEDYKAVMNDEAVLHMEEVISEVELPYSLAPFQRTAISVLASGHDVVLVQATGSGKMTIPLLVSKIRHRSVARGVAIITQPLTGLMMEKLANSICKSALITMSGDIVVANTSAEPTDDAKLSCSVEQLLNEGDIEVLFGHPESRVFTRTYFLDNLPN